MEPAKKSKKKPWGRYVYGKLRVWEDGYITGAGYVCLVRRNQERVYVVCPIYENGRYPYFPKNKLSASYLMELPKPLILDLARRIKKSKVRIRKLQKHKWNIKWFPMEDKSNVIEPKR